MTDKRSGFMSRMLSWLNDEVAPDGMTISVDTPLFATRVLDSLRVLELIAFTEQEIGSPIPDSQIRMDNFQTVSRIATVFVREKEASNVAA